MTKKTETAKENVGLEENPAKRALCLCGHIGDGADGGQHATATATSQPGHGTCMVKGCGCTQFTWERWLDEKPAKTAKRASAKKHVPSEACEPQVGGTLHLMKAIAAYYGLKKLPIDVELGDRWLVERRMTIGEAADALAEWSFTEGGSEQLLRHLIECAEDFAWQAATDDKLVLDEDGFPVGCNIPDYDPDEQPKEPEAKP